MSGDFWGAEVGEIKWRRHECRDGVVGTGWRVDGRRWELKGF